MKVGLAKSLEQVLRCIDSWVLGPWCDYLLITNLFQNLRHECSTDRYRSVFILSGGAAMNPDQMEIFFKRLFALKVPKATWSCIEQTRLVWNYGRYQPLLHYRIGIETNSSIVLCPAASQVIIFMVLLISWMEDPAIVNKKDIQVIEYFAGVARIAQVSERRGYQSVAYDLDFGKRVSEKSGKRNPLDLNSNAGFVLAVKLILRCRFNELVAVFAVCCSSFVPVNRGTGRRDLLVPEGDENVPSVRRSNKLLSRRLGIILYLIFYDFNSIFPSKYGRS